MQIQLSDHFTYRRLLRFVFPSVMMMIFVSIAEIVDGYFVSNFAGKTPFAALNLIWPYFGIMGTVGFMFGTGGSALISKTLGEGDEERARRYFSLIVYTAIAAGVILMVIGIATTPAVARLLGAEGEMLTGAVEYGRILMISLPAFILAYLFQSLFVTAEKPKTGLAVMAVSVCTNIALDVVFIAVLGLGLAGAAGATVIAEFVGGITPLVYFIRRKGNSRTAAGRKRQARAIKLYLTKTKFEPKVLGRTCYNGLSELAANVSVSVVSMLYNVQLLKLVGENGVAAYGVLMYISVIFSAVFMGYSVGSAPIIGYHYGARNTAELHSMFGKSLKIVAVSGVCMAVFGIVCARPLALIFVSYDAELLELTIRAIRFYAVSYLLCGFNIFASSFFTALSNGAVSATISVLRTFVFQVLCVLLLPVLFGIDGIWLALTAAELLALIVSIFFFARMRGKYQY